MTKRQIVMSVGAVVLLVGIVSLIFGAISKGKAGQLASAPLVSTADAAAKGGEVASKDGILAVRGRTVCDDPLYAPISGTPVLYYTYSVTAAWKETVPDKDHPGKNKTENKTKSVGGDSNAAEFSIDDGSGPVRIAVSGVGDLELTESPTQTYTSRSSNESSITLGARVYKVSGFPEGTTFTARESVLNATDSLFACGKIENGTIGPSDMILSTKSPEELIASAQSSAKTGFTLGAIFSGLGVAGLLGGLILVKNDDNLRKT